jgi:hypothetical protein
LEYVARRIEVFASLSNRRTRLLKHARNPVERLVHAQPNIGLKRTGIRNP